MTHEANIKLTLELNDDQATALAQLVKRIGWRDWRSLSQDDAEAYQMRSACDQLRSSLANAGFAPR